VVCGACDKCTRLHAPYTRQGHSLHASSAYDKCTRLVHSIIPCTKYIRRVHASGSTWVLHTLQCVIPLRISSMQVSRFHASFSLADSLLCSDARVAVRVFVLPNWCRYPTGATYAAKMAGWVDDSLIFPRFNRRALCGSVSWFTLVVHSRGSVSWFRLVVHSRGSLSWFDLD
jgi:hypothetical protein